MLFEEIALLKQLASISQKILYNIKFEHVNFNIRQ